MRYAILSDIHGNLEALTAVMETLASERIDRYLCLGDMIGYGADSVACLELLQARDAVCVAGNHEWGCIGRLELAWFHEAARAVILWTRDRLSVTDLDHVRQLPLTTIVEPFTFVHGTLTHPERFEYLADAAQAMETLSACQTLICLVGHTHQPCCVEYDRRRRRLTRFMTSSEQAADIEFVDDPHAMRYLINPGSVGQPRDGDARASVAIVDTAMRRVAFRRVAYDIAAAQRKIREAGLPAFLADRLAIGR